MREHRLSFTKIYLFGLFLMCCNICYAQHKNAHIDSLNKILGSTVDLNLAMDLEKVIQKQAREDGYNLGIIDCTIKIAIKLNSAGHYGTTLQKLENINGLITKYGSDDDKFCAYNLKAMIYWKIGFYDQANTFYDSAKVYAKRERDLNDRHYRIGETFLGKALNFRDSKAYPSDTVKSYLMKNLEEKKLIDKNSPFYGGIVSAGFYLCQFYINLKELDSAKKYLDVAHSVSLDPGHRNSYWVMDRSYFQGMLYLAQKDYKKSLVFLHESMDMAYTLNADYRKRDIALKLSEAYAGVKDIAQEKNWLKRYTHSNDSITRVEKLTTNEALEFLKPQIQKAKRDERYNGAVLAIVIVSSLLVIGIAFFYFRRSRKAHAYNKELSDKIRVLSENIKTPEREVEELKQITAMAMANDPGFFTKYNEYDPEFSKKLIKMAPDITAADLEFCAYIKLSFDTKEIARYANLSVRAVESRRSRIRKKLGILSGTDLNLWMSQF